MHLIPRQTYSEGKKVSKIDHVQNEHPCNTFNWFSLQQKKFKYKQIVLFPQGINHQQACTYVLLLCKHLSFVN